MPTAQLYHVVTTTDVPYHVCGAQQDNTTVCVPSDGRGASFYPVGGGESGYVAADPLHPDIFYAGSFGGYITWYDHSTNQRREINVWPEYPVGQSAEDLKERFQWTTPILFSPADPKILYTSSQHLFKTTNQGQSWTAISPDLTRHDPSTLGPSGGPITHDQTGVETYATIFTVAPSRLDVNLIWTHIDLRQKSQFAAAHCIPVLRPLRRIEHDGSLHGACSCAARPPDGDNSAAATDGRHRGQFASV